MKKKRFASALLAALMLTQLAACGIPESAKETAGKVAEQAKEKAEQVKEQVTEWCGQFDAEEFSKGWDHAVSIVGSAVSASDFKDIGNALSGMQSEFSTAFGAARTIASDTGFAAEKWSSLFNIDALAGSSAYRSGGADTSAFSENACRKYYQESAGKAAEQAAELMEQYSKYAADAKNPIDLEDFINQYQMDGNALDALFAAVCEGQTPVIPADQFKDAVKFLNGKSSKLDVSGLDAEQAKLYQETMNHLKELLANPDGAAAASIALADLEAIAQLSQSGDFNPQNFGISASQIITPKYVVKQSVSKGLTSAALSAVLSLGPDIVSILKEAAKTGNINDVKLKEIGADGLLSNSEGFVEGSVSCALLTACKAGKLGPGLKKASPELIAALTVLTVDAIRYGYSLSKGEITTEDYSNLMAEEITTAVKSQKSGKALQALLPGIPIAYMAGCMAGGVLSEDVLDKAKDIVMEIKDGGGFEAVVPKDSVNTMNVISDMIAGLHLEEQLSGFQDAFISTLNSGEIQLKTAN